MSFRKYLIETMAREPQEIIFDIKDEDDNEVGNVNGIIHYDKSRLFNWLQAEYVDNKTIQYINRIPDNKLLPVAILKNINVFDNYRNKGFGNEGMTQFLDEAIGASSVILIADVGEVQGINLEKWYQKFGFKTIGNSAVSDYPVMILQN